jgi:membrane protease YdiL (CAAX protease family)
MIGPMTEPDVERAHWLPRIALVSFVIGLALVAIGFGRVDGAGPWFRTGAVGCLIAYFLVLFDNFKRKLPVQTRAGPVRREDGAFKYALPFVVFTLMGLVALLVILTTPGT